MDQQLCNSFRKKNPPLDLDTALFLQSQASYVQEPNRVSTFRAHEATNSTSSLPKDIPRTSSPKQLASQEIAYRRMPSLSVDYQNLEQFYYRDYNNNISVDYIDCLSNDDLSPRQPYAARAMSGCKKHLKFHRNRVDPQNHIHNNSHNQSSTSIHQQNAHPNLVKDASLQHSQLREAPGPSRQFAFDHFDTKTDQSQHFNGLDSNSTTTISERQSDDQNNQPSSVLYPIPVVDVKKQTYYLGSVNYESLLGQDELYRYFPNGRVNIFVCTWNQNRKRAPTNICDLLLPNQVVNLPDVYAIGVQEAFSSQTDYLREWEIDLQVTLGPSHVLLKSCSLGVLHLCLFIRRDLIWFCSAPEESVYNSRSMPTNMTKTKGAISIAFRFFGTSFMFTNCHFPAHENKLKDRIEEYQRIINSIDLPKDLKSLKPRYLSNDSTARFDCVFFMGDLNFRLEQRTFDETLTIMEDIFQQKEPSYESLTQNDELLKVMESGQAFHGFDEAPIKFPPTFKFLAKTNLYDKQTRRVPSYTDRILFRSKRQRHIRCINYDWLPQLLSSDHKPVYCLFDVLIRPGHEQFGMVASLNAGLFQRAVYVEALKRRAQDSNGARDNGTGGNLICSIQ